MTEPLHYYQCLCSKIFLKHVSNTTYIFHFYIQPFTLEAIFHSCIMNPFILIFQQMQQMQTSKVFKLTETGMTHRYSRKSSNINQLEAVEIIILVNDTFVILNVACSPRQISLLEWRRFYLNVQTHNQLARITSSQSRYCLCWGFFHILWFTVKMFLTVHFFKGKE